MIGPHDAVMVLPAHQRLGADAAARREIDDRLVRDDELMAPHGVGELPARRHVTHDEKRRPARQRHASRHAAEQPAPRQAAQTLGQRLAWRAHDHRDRHRDRAPHDVGRVGRIVGRGVGGLAIEREHHGRIGARCRRDDAAHLRVDHAEAARRDRARLGDRVRARVRARIGARARSRREAVEVRGRVGRDVVTVAPEHERLVAARHVHEVEPRDHAVAAAPVGRRQLAAAERANCHGAQERRALPAAAVIVGTGVAYRAMLQRDAAQFPQIGGGARLVGHAADFAERA